MRICLFEDRWENLEPLAATRPVFDLLCGMTTLGEKQRRWLNASEWGVCIRPELAAWHRRQHPDLPVNEYGWLLGDRVVLVRGRWLPPATVLPVPETPCVGLAGNEFAWAVLGPEQLEHFSWSDLPKLLADWQRTLPAFDVGGHLIDYPWQFVDHNADAIRNDFASHRPADSQPPQHALAILGTPDQLWTASSARIEPYVVADMTRGPIVIDDNTVVAAFSRLEGPCYIGPGAQLLGAKIRGGTTVGPCCRVGGEVEASILHGFSNKYHEGFLGHSYVGEWVNLGAGTHNSDLRNDYGPVNVPMPAHSVATGLAKVGCFIGDHVKTGLGTLINTGSHLGAFSNLLPAGRLAPKYVPAFSAWWNGQLCEPFDLPQLLQTAERMMQRRGRQLVPEQAALYEALHAVTAHERKRLLEGTEPRLWRQSA